LRVKFALLLLALLVDGAASAYGQSAQFFGGFTSYQQTEVQFPQAIVANASGALYVSGTNLLGYVPVDGNGVPILSGQASVAVTTSLSAMGMAIDSANNIYRADAYGAQVQKFTYGGSPTTFSSGTIGSGWIKPGGVAVDSNFNVYVLDAGTGSIVELTPSGSSYTQTTLYTSNTLINTTGLSIDAAGNFYVASGTNYGVSTVYMGTTAAVYKLTKSGSSYTLSSIGSGWSSPSYTVVDNAGNIWVADYGAGQIVLLVPNGSSYTQSTYQTIANLRALNVNKTGKVYGDAGNGVGSALIWAGGSAPHNLGTYPVGTAATNVPVTVSFPAATVVGGFVVSTQGSTGRDFTQVSTGTTCAPGTYSASSTCTLVVGFTPSLAGLREGVIEITNSSGAVVATNYVYGVGQAPLVSLTPGVISTFAGTGTACSPSTAACGDSGAATSAQLNTPADIVEDVAGNYYIADLASNRVRKISTSGVMTTVAGTGAACPTNTPTAACGDGAQATAAQMVPAAIALDGAGILYIADATINRVRAVNLSTGVITTVAGTGTVCSSTTAACGDGGPATSANFNGPEGLVVDGYGNLLIADRNDNRIRSVNLSSGIITTVAGTGAQCATATSACGDSGPATAAQLNAPFSIAVDTSGNYYIADSGDNRVREISYLTGAISTIAGTGASCASTSCGDGGAATSAKLNGPLGVSVDPAGNVYIADSGDSVVRKVSAAGGTISAVAGTYTACSSTTATCGDGGGATSAAVYSPYRLSLDHAGNLLIADTNDNRIRAVNVTSTPGLNFQATTLNTVSADSPKSVTVSNVGNASLTVSAPVSGTNPTISSGFLLDATNTCPSVTTSAGSLAAGGSCLYAVDFKPTAGGADNGSLVVTDNNLGASGATQTIALSGTGAGVAPSVATVSAVSTVYGSTTGITVTATESGTAGAVTGGVVTFGTAGSVGGSFSSPTCTLSAAGTCSVTYTPTGTLTPGVYSGDITASFGQIGGYLAASGSSNLTVAKATPVITVVASPAAVFLLNPVTLTATLTGVSGGAAPTNGVTISVGGTAVGSPTLNGGSPDTAGLLYTPTTAGALSVTASYAGDSNYNPVSTATATTLTAVDFTITPATTATTTTPGTIVNYGFTITPVGATTFPAAIALSAVGSPTGAVAQLNPQSVAAGTGASGFALLVTAPVLAEMQRVQRPGSYKPFAPVALALLLLPFSGKLRRRAGRLGRYASLLLVLVASVSAMAGLTGCGTGIGIFAQAPKTYTFTVTGTAGALSHSATVTLIDE